MPIVEIMGRINEAAQLELNGQTDLPPGEVRVIIESIDAEAADETLWDEQFSKSQDTLSRMAREALAEDDAGLTEDFDPDVDLK